ncbi:glycerate kinase [bacterium]|nr:glycerate kinase [bacterium]
MQNPKKISPEAFSNPVIDRNGELGRAACEIMVAAIQAVDPYQCTLDNVRLTEQEIIIAGRSIERSAIDRVSLIGFGKAAVPMAKAVVDSLGDLIGLAVVVTKDARFQEAQGYGGKLEVLLGGHPVPDAKSVKSTQALLNQLPSFNERDLVLVVISGGGSALFTSPLAGITLDDLQKLTESLLRSGADIQEINTLRKHLDQVKGGRLAARLNPAQVHTLILSDVIGDRLDMIASGPTVPDPTTFDEAWQVITKYNLEDTLPNSIRKFLKAGLAGDQAETLKQSQFETMRVENNLIATNLKAARAAQQSAEGCGFTSLVLSTHLTGLTPVVADFIHGIIENEVEADLPAKKPVCLIFGGETTVKVVGDGKGGRNQDLVLQMVRKLAGYQEKVLFISLATDGEDGPTDAAGAASDALVFRYGASEMGMNIDTYISTNNAYQYFNQVGGLLRTGATGTNVNDLIFVLIGSPDTI